MMLNKDEEEFITQRSAVAPGTLALTGSETNIFL